MMKHKRLLSFVLALVLVLGMMPRASAAEENTCELCQGTDGQHAEGCPMAMLSYLGIDAEEMKEEAGESEEETTAPTETTVPTETSAPTKTSAPTEAPTEATTAPTEASAPTEAPTTPTEPEKDETPSGPKVGDTIWIKSGSSVYKNDNSAHQLLGNYAVKITNIITDENGAAAVYEFEFTSLGIGEAYLQYSGYKYVIVTDTSVSEPDATTPSQPSGGESSVTLSDGATVTAAGQPEDTTLTASAVEGSALTSAQSKAGVGKALFAYDISILNEDGSEWQPTDGSVTVTLTIPSLSSSDAAKLRIAHIHGSTVETIKPTVTDGNTLTFTVDGFSVFLGYTVDFEYNGTLHSIEGGGSILLSELFTILEVPATVDQVTNVVFSDPTLVSVTSENGDWKLESLQAFQTEETLTIALSTGETIVINVTDAVYYEDQTVNITSDATYTGGIEIDGTVTINLNGNTLNAAWIEVNANATLIVNGPGTVKHYGTSYRLFEVYSGGKLQITGTSSNPVTINGNDSASNPSYNSTIYCNNNSTLDFDYVKIINCYNYSNYNYGGAIHCEVSKINIDLYRCLIKDCGAYYGAAIDMHDACSGTLNLTQCTIDNCDTLDNGNDSGGAIRTNGSGKVKATLKECIFRNNHAGNNGGAIYWNANGSGAMLTLEDCHFVNNSTDGDGGAIFLEAKMQISGNTTPGEANTDGNPCNGVSNNGTIFTGNTAGGKGGAIAINSYSGGNVNYDGSATSTSSLTMGDNILFTGNSATNGGAISMYVKKTGDLSTGFTFVLNIDGAQIKNNTASSQGGGIYLESSYSNYKTNLSLLSGSIDNNTATNDRGGGVYAKNTSVTFGGTGDGISISNNSAPHSSEGLGGGLYVLGNEEAYGTINVTLANGKVNNNSAAWIGGGMYLAGKQVRCEISGDGTVSGNTAKRGGGIFMNTSSVLTVSGGIITGNEAICHNPSTNLCTNTSHSTTALGETSGVGGGIYINSNCTFNMVASAGSEVGLYGNIAEFAADDAYASGSGTTLNLPKVASMPLAGTPYEFVTGWYIDYCAGDTQYPDIYGSENPGRYRGITYGERVSAGEQIESGTAYYCLTLGKAPGLVIEKQVLSKERPKESFTVKAYQGGEVLGTVTFSPSDFVETSTGVWVAKDAETMKRMPIGEIIVEETFEKDPSAYTFKYASTEIEAKTYNTMRFSFTMTDEGEKATFVAECALADLTIIKKGVESEDAGASFVFHVQSTDSNGIDMNVVVYAKQQDEGDSTKYTGSVTIKDLPAGSYTVTETGGYWRYEIDTPKDATHTVVMKGSDEEVLFTNKRTEDKWLDDWAKATNDFSKTSAEHDSGIAD